MDEVRIKKGTIIHLEGVPFELAEDALVLGNKENLELLFRTKSGAATVIPSADPHP